MSIKRAFTIARRVMRQLGRDRRTIALLFIGPMVALTLGAILFRAEPARVPVGVVNHDQGITIPLSGEINLADRIVEEPMRAFRLPGRQREIYLLACIVGIDSNGMLQWGDSDLQYESSHCNLWRSAVGKALTRSRPLIAHLSGGA